MHPSDFDYGLSQHLIAQAPAVPRDAARLMVYSRKLRTIRVDRFRNLAKYLPEGSVLVFNKTKVIPARLFLKKETGGRVEILYIARTGGLVQVLANRKLLQGLRLHITQRLYFTVRRSDRRFYYLKPSFAMSRLAEVFDSYGHAPIPPYIHHPEARGKKLREQYQTVFARIPGSIAAPTASLHFTKRLLSRLKKAGHEIEFITLHVGLGTFAPLTEENMREGKLHQESFMIDAATARRLNTAKKQGRPIIAVGTTVVRTLETAAAERASFRRAARHGIKAGSGSTELFIRQGYRFRFVDGIITNFHVPKSSLLMLVSAFCSRKEVLTLYETAIRKKFKFFSFGDGMLLY